MKYIGLSLIYIYQKLLKPILIALGFRREKMCKFHPTCSDYSKECFRKYSFIKATVKTVKRVVRCNPFSQGGVDLP